MLINLSDILSDQHKTVEETVRLEMEEIRLQSGTYPIISKEPVHAKVGAYMGKNCSSQLRLCSLLIMG